MNTSRRRTRAMARNAGRTRKRPASTTTATAPSTASVCAHAGRPVIQVAAACDPPACAPSGARDASSGKTASIGITAMSWKSSTAIDACPPAGLSRSFSASVCRTIAVEESESVMPIAKAAGTRTPSAMAMPATATVVMSTCSPPMPRIGARRRHKRSGSSSRPITKSIMTTPNSATCIMSCPSAPRKPRPKGPIAVPASR